MFGLCVVCRFGPVGSGRRGIRGNLVSGFKRYAATGFEIVGSLAALAARAASYSMISAI